MSAFGTFLRKTTTGVAFWCQGCEHAHHVELVGEKRWTFSNDPIQPTIIPSYRAFIPTYDDAGKLVSERTICHLFVTSGVIIFLNDCAHALKGQTLPLQPFPSPEEYGFNDEAH